MEIHIAHDRQTLFDIALQAYGRAELAYDIALANGLSLSEPLRAGQQVQLPAPTRAVDTEVLNAYALQGIRPATGITEEQEQTLAAEGVGYWHIKAPAPPFTVQESWI